MTASSPLHIRDECAVLPCDEGGHGNPLCADADVGSSGPIEPEEADTSIEGVVARTARTSRRWRDGKGKNKERMAPRAQMQKGLRILANYRPAAPQRVLPELCRRPVVLRYDNRRFDLRAAVARDLLGRGKPDATLDDSGDVWRGVLETYWLSAEERLHQPPGKVHDRVRRCASLCDIYERLIREVVAPQLLTEFNGCCQDTEEGSHEQGHGIQSQQRRLETVLLYQFPPTLRIYCSCPAGTPDAKLVRQSAAVGDTGTNVHEVDAHARNMESIGAGRQSNDGETSRNVFEVEFEALGRLRDDARCGHQLEETLPPAEFKALGRLHNDAQYGHQPGEVNYWLPLTRLSPHNTLWAESAENACDFRPMLLRECGYDGVSSGFIDEDNFGADSAPGETAKNPLGEQWLPIQRFHGTCCRHHTQPNSSGRTRVSLDFRCAPQSAFDPLWRPPGILHRHEMREVRFRPDEVGGGAGEGGGDPLTSSITPR